MKYIRWHALSSYTRWNEYLIKKGYEVIEFHHNLPYVELKWADENQFYPMKDNEIFQIGLEKIKRFKPDILYCSSPLFYSRSNFLNKLINILPKKPKLVAWYGANCGDEEAFRYFDLTYPTLNILLMNYARKQYVQIFCSIPLSQQFWKKYIPEKRINKLGFLAT